MVANPDFLDMQRKIKARKDASTETPYLTCIKLIHCLLFLVLLPAIFSLDSATAISTFVVCTIANCMSCC